jgi:small subunit ribosomal protein S1
MPDHNLPDPQTDNDSTESFSDLLSQYERAHARVSDSENRRLQGTVVAVTDDSVLLDIGYKTEGILPLSIFQDAGETVKPGDQFPVSITGRDPEGYYLLTRFKVARPKDWTALERAFAEKSAIVGSVTGQVKGGFSVDVGVRAFMPASRSGVRDAAEMEKLVGQEIRCRITKLDVTEEDLVVDRRAVLEEEDRSTKERRYTELKEGDMVTGTVRTLTDYGAFIDIGGIDGLLHVSDISWSRIDKSSDVLSAGQEIEAKVLKVDTERQRISLGLKQLQPHPWDAVADKYKAGERVHGTVTRLADFGFFVELEPGIEGLVHISEMSWAKQRFTIGSAIEGQVTSITKFGAFVQVTEGIEGMVHVSEISAEKRINHPQDVLKVGQVVQAAVLAVDSERRLMRLSMKQLVPTSIDEYIAEHKPGDVVTGRVMEEGAERLRVELGEGIHATCRFTAKAPAKEESKSEAKADLSSLTSMLQAKWKSGPSNAASSKPDAIHAGQVRSFRIGRLDPEAKTIELELA